MNHINYDKLNVLVADDFSSFRSTVSGMLAQLGVAQVELAANGASVIDLCQRKQFDVILCDYDLGPGKNGQHVLEELRYKNVITHNTVFIIVSADAAKDVVLATYDCEPDDYLMKPITQQMLQLRMTRLLNQRRVLAPIYAALDAGDRAKAIALLIDMSIADDRHAVIAQKRLGEMFIAEGEISRAEKVYTRALQARRLDWARLGLARVKQLQGELEVAAAWLQQIISDNPLFLPAYDVLATNWEKLEQDVEVQDTVQQSVTISPKSILRQKRLAAVAERNGDLLTALKALRATVKLGEFSCHACVDDNLHFARVAAASLERESLPVASLTTEAVGTLSLARARFVLSRDQGTRVTLLEVRVQALAHHTEEAIRLLTAVEGDTQPLAETSLSVQMDKVLALQAVAYDDQAKALTQALLSCYAYDQRSLEKLDSLMVEPVSDANRKMVAAVNREGIGLYNQSRFDDAVMCFTKALRLFPKHVGIRLNIVQSLVGKARAGQNDEQTHELTMQALATIDALIDSEHVQYGRFLRLKGLADVGFVT